MIIEVKKGTKESIDLHKPDNMSYDLFIYQLLYVRKKDWIIKKHNYNANEVMDEVIKRNIKTEVK